MYLSGDYAGGPDPTTRTVSRIGRSSARSASTRTRTFGRWTGGAGRKTRPCGFRRGLAWSSATARRITLEEKGPILRAVHGAMELAMRESGTHDPMPMASASDKASRALGFAARAAAGTGVDSEVRVGRQAGEPAMRLQWAGLGARTTWWTCAACWGSRH